MLNKAESITRLLASVLFAASLAACSGGEIGADNNNTGTDTPDPGDGDGVITDPADSVTGLSLLTQSTSLRSDAESTDEGVTLSALARDANNNVVSGVTILFSATSGALAVTNATTDANGVANAVLTTGGDATIRDVTVSARVGDLSDTVLIGVTGTTLALTGPNSIGTSDMGAFTVTARDAGGDGIGGEVISLSQSDDPQPQVTFDATSLTTDTDGQAEFTVTSGTNSGTATVVASALGIDSTSLLTISPVALSVSQGSSLQEGDGVNLGETAVIRVSVTDDRPSGSALNVDFSSTRGTFSNDQSTIRVPVDNGVAEATISSNGPGAAGPATITATTDQGGASDQIGIRFIAVDPSLIQVQAEPAAVPLNGASSVRAIVRDSQNNPVEDAIVDFSLIDSTGGNISPSFGSTDGQGVVTTTFTAGGVSSGSGQGASGNTASQVTGTIRSSSTSSNAADITVGGQSLRIVIGTGNDIIEPDFTTYDKPYVVIVSDAAGNPVPASTIVSLKIVGTNYREGRLVGVSSTPDGEPDRFALVQGRFIECPGEDTNRNSILDAGEDTNGSFELEPDNVTTVPGSIVLDEDGAAQFNLRYPQSHALWTEVRLSASVQVAGTEETEFVQFYLPVLLDDLDDINESPPNQVSPYGEDLDCSTDDRPGGTDDPTP